MNNKIINKIYLHNVFRNIFKIRLVKLKNKIFINVYC